MAMRILLFSVFSWTLSLGHPFSLTAQPRRDLLVKNRRPCEFHRRSSKGRESGQHFTSRTTILYEAPSPSTATSYVSHRRAVYLKIIRPAKSALWPLVRLLSFIQRAIFRIIVKACAGFLTALLIDPGVNRAAASAIKDGINMWFTQPNVKDKLAKLQKNLSENEPYLAKDIGSDFPMVLFNFLSGLILQGFDQPESDSNDSVAIEEERKLRDDKEYSNL